MWNSFRIVRGVDGPRDWGTVRPATRRGRPLGLPIVNHRATNSYTLKSAPASPAPACTNLKSSDRR
jgi:hypothetical protein